MIRRTSTRSLSTLATLALVASATATLAPTATAADGDQAMVTTELTRIADSRYAVGVADEMTHAETATIQITGEVDTIAIEEKGKATVVPADADAVVLNMTAVGATLPGFFVAWPADKDMPETSNINFAQGDTIANGATVPLSADGKIKVYSHGEADLLLDVAGYYRDGTYTAMDASRVLDTREEGANSAYPEPLPAGSLSHIKITDSAAKPNVTLNVTVDQPMADGYISCWTAADTVTEASFKAGPNDLPTTSNLNFHKGQTIANTVSILPNAAGFITCFNLAPTSLIIDKVDESTNDRGVLFETPQRKMDTRESMGASGKTGVRTLDLSDLATAGDMGAVILNVTVDNAEALGFLSVGPKLEEGKVTTSVLNFRAGQIVANRVIIPISELGSLDFYTNMPADIIVDVLGYTHAVDAATGEAIMVDLTAGATTTYPAGATNLTAVSPNSAFVIPGDGAEGDNHLINADGTWTVKTGAKATVTAADGTTTMKDLIAVPGATDGSLMIALNGLADGTYTVSVPVTDGTNESTWSSALEIKDGATSPALAASRTFDLAFDDTKINGSNPTMDVTIADQTLNVRVEGFTTAAELASKIVSDLDEAGNSAVKQALTDAGITVEADGGAIKLTKTGATAPAASDLSMPTGAPGSVSDSDTTALSAAPGAWDADGTAATDTTFAVGGQGVASTDTAPVSVEASPEDTLKVKVGFEPSKLEWSQGGKTLEATITKDGDFWMTTIESAAALNSAGFDITTPITGTFTGSQATATFTLNLK